MYAIISATSPAPRQHRCCRICLRSVGHPGTPLLGDRHDPVPGAGHGRRRSRRGCGRAQVAGWLLLGRLAVAAPLLDLYRGKENLLPGIQLNRADAEDSLAIAVSP